MEELFASIFTVVIFLIMIRPLVWMYKYFKFGALFFEELYKGYKKKTEVESEKEV